MMDIVKLLGEYGVTLIIVGLFIYAWLDDRRNRNEIIEKTLGLENNNNEILNEMKKTNENTSKSLELLHISLQNQLELLKTHDEGQKAIAKEIQSIGEKLGRN